MNGQKLIHKGKKYIELLTFFFSFSFFFWGVRALPHTYQWWYLESVLVLLLLRHFFFCFGCQIPVDCTHGKTDEGKMEKVKTNRSKANVRLFLDNVDAHVKLAE